MLLDNSTVYTVGVDKFIQQFDIRADKVAQRVNLNGLASMNYIASPQGAFTENFLELISKTKHATKTKATSARDLHDLIISHQDGSISVWDDRKMAEPLKIISIHEEDCRSVEFDPSGRYFASTSFDNTCKIYDTSTDKVVSTLTAHTDRVVLAKWHPFFPILISTSADSQVKAYASKNFVETY